MGLLNRNGKLQGIDCKRSHFRLNYWRSQGLGRAESTISRKNEDQRVYSFSLWSLHPSDLRKRLDDDYVPEGPRLLHSQQ
jgi:hypothetical protein